MQLSELGTSHPKQLKAEGSLFRSSALISLNITDLIRFVIAEMRMNGTLIEISTFAGIKIQSTIQRFAAVGSKFDCVK